MLTGIKPTGSPHVGNHLGAIRPALRLADEGLEAMYFIADYHALTTIQDSKVLARLTYEVAATWLALGLDPERVLFYRQSDVPEIFELAWALACFTAKGWMNKVHASRPSPRTPFAGASRIFIAPGSPAIATSKTANFEASMRSANGLSSWPPSRRASSA